MIEIAVLILLLCFLFYVISQRKIPFKEVPSLGSRKVYLAGPFFNAGQRYEQEMIALTLERAGYETFLPQRDGLSLGEVADVITRENNLPRQRAEEMASEIISSFDIFQLSRCDTVVANCNGLEPDSGTVVEASTARSMGIPVILFYNDVRTFQQNVILNPLLINLSSLPGKTLNERVVQSIDRVPLAVAFVLPQLQKSIPEALQDEVIEGGQISVERFR